MGSTDSYSNCTQKLSEALLRVLDGDSPEDSPALFHYCGTYGRPPVAKSSGSSMTVVLERGRYFRDHHFGFRAFYTSTLGEAGSTKRPRSCKHKFEWETHCTGRCAFGVASDVVHPSPMMLPTR